MLSSQRSIPPDDSDSVSMTPSPASLYLLWDDPLRQHAATTREPSLRPIRASSNPANGPPTGADVCAKLRSYDWTNWAVIPLASDALWSGPHPINQVLIGQKAGLRSLTTGCIKLSELTSNQHAEMSGQALPWRTIHS